MDTQSHEYQIVGVGLLLLLTAFGGLTNVWADTPTAQDCIDYVQTTRTVLDQGVNIDKDPNGDKKSALDRKLDETDGAISKLALDPPKCEDAKGKIVDFRGKVTQLAYPAGDRKVKIHPSGGLLPECMPSAFLPHAFNPSDNVECLLDWGTVALQCVTDIPEASCAETKPKPNRP